MRIWDLPPRYLCRAHLLGEHRELHCIWTVLTEGKKGYSQHPETLRWKGKLGALFRRHAQLVKEMRRRGYSHASPLDSRLATGSRVQSAMLESPDSQMQALRAKGCDCMLPRIASVQHGE